MCSCCCVLFASNIGSVHALFCFLTTNQQARSHGTIMFKVIPITERPVHNQTMVSLLAQLNYYCLCSHKKIFTPILCVSLC